MAIMLVGALFHALPGARTEPRRKNINVNRAPRSAASSPPPSLARERVHHIADETLKRLVLDELPVDLRVVLQEMLHHLMLSILDRIEPGRA